jgi:hypothetical protein
VHWTNYALHTYRRHGKYWGGGWLVRDQATADQEGLLSFNEPDRYCGMIGADTVETSKFILDEAEILPYEDGGIAKPIETADGGLQIFHVGFTNLNQGWHGFCDEGTARCSYAWCLWGSLFRRNKPHDSKWLQSENQSDVTSGLWGEQRRSAALADASTKASESICYFPVSAAPGRT